MSYEWIQVYFGVSTLIDASSSDSLKAEDEQKEVKFQVHYMIFSELTSSITNLPCQYPKEKKKVDQLWICGLWNLALFLLSQCITVFQLIFCGQS